MVGQPDRPLLRLRDRRRAAGRARRRLARVGVGPERGSRVAVAGRPRPSRRSLAGWLLDAARPAPDGVASASSPAPRAPTRPRSPRPATRVLARPAGTSRRDGLHGAPRVARRGRRGARTSTIDRRCGCSASATASVASCAADDQGRMRPDALARRARAGRRAGDRLRAGRQRQHRRLRPARPDRRRLRGGTAPGCTSTAPSASGPRPRPRCAHLVAGRRARRLVGDRRAQVAQRPVRLRPRLRARDPRRARRAMAVAAAYLAARRTARSPSDWMPESSRRARGFAV